MSYYTKHVFFCTNQRDLGAECCHSAGSGDLQAYAKARVNQLKLSGGSGKVRINRAGCLNRCDEGPVLVVYPEAVWYRVFDKADVEEIIQSHILGNTPVDRLRLAD